MVNWELAYSFILLLLSKTRTHIDPSYVFILTSCKKFTKGLKSIRHLDLYISETHTQLAR